MRACHACQTEWAAGWNVRHNWLRPRYDASPSTILLYACRVLVEHCVMLSAHNSVLGATSTNTPGPRGEVLIAREAWREWLQAAVPANVEECGTWERHLADISIIVSMVQYAWMLLAHVTRTADISSILRTM